ncbi:hypothetical protein MLD38_039461 [Melastoma candidum]|uniref:Uncharacterized protein n=1 Tax=Melastoma candidum TaxID=119954 RepID=A0ACB9L322_9MYRT|nr:hypothetical protein MLD38_039461 [Melastoma candidum]
MRDRHSRFRFVYPCSRRWLTVLFQPQDSAADCPSTTAAHGLCKFYPFVLHEAWQNHPSIFAVQAVLPETIHTHTNSRNCSFLHLNDGRYFRLIYVFLQVDRYPMAVVSGIDFLSSLMHAVFDSLAWFHTLRSMTWWEQVIAAGVYSGTRCILRIQRNCDAPEFPCLGGLS